MLDNYILKKLLKKFKLYLLEYSLNTESNVDNKYFIKKKLKLNLNYNINLFPLLLSCFGSLNALSEHIKKTLSSNLVLIKISYIIIKTKFMYFSYVQNLFFIVKFFSILKNFNSFLFNLFKIK